MNIESTTGEVTAVTPANVVVDRGNGAINPNASIQGIVNSHKTISQPIANRVIGEITAAMQHNAANAAGEIALGDVIADAQLAATQPAGFGEAVAAFMNPGGIRSPGLTFPQSVGEGDGKVTYGEAFTTQPFGNSLVTLTLTGAQIEAMLEQQFVGCGVTNAPASYNYPAGENGQTFNRILQVSAGFTYTWKLSGPACDKVDPATIQINGVTVDPAASYRITVNNFLADGGDKFYVLQLGTNRLGGAQDIDALEAWFNNPATDSDPSTAGVQVAPGPQNRITQIP
jgi:5'-nucleotidase